MASEGYSFKVFWKDQVRRFRLTEKPGWIYFLKVLDEQIFKGEGYHVELLLQYSLTGNTGDRNNISNEDEWFYMLEITHNQPCIKLYVQEAEEGMGFYFKDAPAPEALYSYLEAPRVFNTQIQFSDDSRWCPFSQLEITKDFVRLGDNLIVDFVRGDDDSISWTNEKNETSVNIGFTNLEDENKVVFGGLLIHKAEETELLFRGESVPVRKEELAKLEEAKRFSPSHLGCFFPGGKILPNHIPPLLKGVVKVTPTEVGEMELDVDLEALYVTSHNEAIRLMTEEKYDECFKFLSVAVELKPTSSVVNYNLGCYYALTGHSSKAMDYLETAFAYGYCDYSKLVTDPDLISLHETPEFWELMKQMEDKASA